MIMVGSCADEDVENNDDNKYKENDMKKTMVVAMIIDGDD